MPGREKIVKGLECCCAHIVGKTCDDCPYDCEYGISECTSMFTYDALALLKEQQKEIENLKQTAQSMMEGICLLKEQEAVEPRPAYFDVFKSARLYHCGICNEFIVENQKYCQVCGRKVKWE